MSGPTTASRTYDSSVRLRAFPRGSAPERLAVAVCAGSELRPPRVARLALWIARDRLTPEELGIARARLDDCSPAPAGRFSLIAPATRLLFDAGIDPRCTRFFNPEQERIRLDPQP